MSISYLLLHDNENSININSLEADLKKRWNTIYLWYPSSQDSPPLSWEIEFDESILEGYINNKKEVVVLQGDLSDVADFVLWYRSVVPREQILRLLDSGYIFGEMLIESHTIKKDIFLKFTRDAE